MNPAMYKGVMLLLIFLVPVLSYLVWFLFRKRLDDINKHLRQTRSLRDEKGREGL